MKDFSQYISEGAKPKRIVLPNQMGTIEVVKVSDPKGEPKWSFDYGGVRGTIVRGWSRMGGGGYSVTEVTDADGYATTALSGTYRTISDAVVKAVAHMRWIKGKG
jgi:hypothetical protein